MIIPDYISPSGYKLFKDDPKAYYIKYLSDNKLPREGQNIHMAVGSAFDTFVKTSLTDDLQTETKFNLREFFEKQVAENHWDLCWEYGTFLLKKYKESGAYFALIKDMELASIEPKFEFDVSAKILGVPIFGKPDAYYVNKCGVVVILDWKVNTFITGKNSKRKYYIIDYKNGQPHPDVIIKNNCDTPVSINYFLEDINPDWAIQQFFYAIGLGSKIGDMFITSIDQVTGAGPSFYTYRAHLSRDYQIRMAKELKQDWAMIENHYPFHRIMDRDANDALLEKLEGPMRDMYL